MHRTERIPGGSTEVTPRCWVCGYEILDGGASTESDESQFVRACHRQQLPVCIVCARMVATPLHTEEIPGLRLLGSATCYWVADPSAPGNSSVVANVYQGSGVKDGLELLLRLGALTDKLVGLQCIEKQGYLFVKWTRRM